MAKEKAVKRTGNISNFGRGEGRQGSNWDLLAEHVQKTKLADGVYEVRNGIMKLYPTTNEKLGGHGNLCVIYRVPATPKAKPEAKPVKNVKVVKKTDESVKTSTKTGAVDDKAKAKPANKANDKGKGKAKPAEKPVEKSKAAKKSK